ncbi:hypothetical protein NOR51B_1687 [Luminiphilus syltensis NOR5-1B]|uniref:SGNH/GDSL hydrolase family protein n=1 Tax=Luminiphilus syltensis NOR5-1B TaxID=565045 RepID=B8KWB9_9GAMM|nr:hypothetical protein [Luminiphilus syltensis]EED35740.1 hypothetical protein NOR51B_1687 [Luminiphilus syltensis NOR5-1B]
MPKNSPLLLLTLFCIVLIPLLFFLRADMLLRPSLNDSCDPLRNALERSDNGEHIKPDSTLVLGANAAIRWRRPPDSVNGVALLIRGIAGLHPQQIGLCYARLIAHYHPQNVVILTDPRWADDRIDTMANALEGIVAARDSLGRSDRIFALSFLLTPANQQDDQRIQTQNVALNHVADASTGVEILDINDSLRGSGGNPAPRFFWPDGQTLNKAGYEYLSAAIENAISAAPMPPNELSSSHARPASNDNT